MPGTIRKKKKVIAASMAALLLLVISNTTIAILRSNDKSRFRRFSVRPMNRNRDIDGLYATLFQSMQNLEWDSEQFHKYTRMHPKTFNVLLNHVRDQLQKVKEKRPLSPEQRLLMTIHYLSEGCSMQELAWNYRVGKATIHQVIKETCSVLWSSLSPTYLSVPDPEKWKCISLEFYKRWNIPNCLGAIDGKHIVIQAPRNTSSVFFNYKKSFSIILMAVCDAYYRFTLVDIGAPGGSHDAAVFRQSNFGAAILNNAMGIPGPSYLPKTNINMNHFFIADSAFPLTCNIMRPYPGAGINNLVDVKRIFNYRLSRARRTIENTFGICRSRWRILRGPINASLEMCELITQACVVLHNFLQSSEKDIPAADRKYCPTGYADYVGDDGEVHEGGWREKDNGLRSVGRQGSNNPNRSATLMRDTLAEYFTSEEGWIPFQEAQIWRGALPH